MWVVVHHETRRASSSVVSVVAATRGKEGAPLRPPLGQCVERRATIPLVGWGTLRKGGPRVLKSPTYRVAGCPGKERGPRPPNLRRLLLLLLLLLLLIRPMAIKATVKVTPVVTQPMVVDLLRGAKLRKTPRLKEAARRKTGMNNKTRMMISVWSASPPLQQVKQELRT